MTSRRPVRRVIGLDIGGSSTRALLDEGGTAIASAWGPSASLTTAGRAMAAEVLDQVLAELASSSGGLGPIDAVCAGTSGSGADRAVDWLTSRLKELVGRHLGVAGNGRHELPVAVVNDARLVLAAHELESGIALVAGTGSIAVGVLDGREERAGGWGYLLGDEGSGYWVVREAMRELSRRNDRHEEPGALAEVFGTLPVTDLLDRFYEAPAPGGWAGLAPRVLDAPDPAAEAICAAAARSLAGLVAEVATALDWRAALPVVVAGGLGAGHRRLSEATLFEIEARLPGAKAAVATRPSVTGAVRLARAVAATSGTARESAPRAVGS
ncbi:MAG: ATPase [Actinomycetota bacterium]|nr:ATPase [Actinomycetota bacterium]